MPTWTKKQKEYGLNANHRWNVKLGAVRSGKTFQDKEDIKHKSQWESVRNINIRNDT